MIKGERTVNKAENVKRVEIFWKDEESRQAEIEIVKEIGAGRAATASLVRVKLDSGETYECVEKLFKPGLLTRFVYWSFFQSPFPYQHVREAISATFFRRSAASRILKAMTGVNDPVAKPLYTRWDEKEKAFVLAAEFVKGRGIIPQQADSMRVRRAIYNYIVRPGALIFGKRLEKKEPPYEEAKELVKLMKQFEGVFRKSGFTGTGWQTSPAALVSTANLLKTEKGYVIVDLESGIPSILVPYYLFRSVFVGMFPFFDDLEPRRLSGFMEREGERIREILGEEEFRKLDYELKRLIEKTRKWKKGEIAVFRNLISLIFSKGKRKAVLEARVEMWNREGVIDRETYTRLSGSRRLFTEPVFFAGFLPGRLGEASRKLKGNKEYRKKFNYYIRNREARKIRIQQYVDEHIDEWILDERFQPGTRPELHFGFKFILHLMMSKLTRPGFHRFFTDREYRKRNLVKVKLFFTSDTYQIEYSKYVIYKGLMEWKKEERLTDEELAILENQLNSGSIQEYVRLFGFQAGLKIFEFVTSSIKVAGFVWYSAMFKRHFPELDSSQPMSTQLLLAFVQTALMNPIPILMMVNTSVWRTLITLSRMISVKRRHISYKTALFFGMIPALGTLAYPVQMFASCEELSVYLMRHIFSRIGRGLPIYGGKDSITELKMIKLIDLLPETFESSSWLWSHTFGYLMGLIWKKDPSKKKEIPQPPAIEIDITSPRGKLIKEYVDELWASLDTA